MDTFSLLFYTFAAVLVFAGFRVITAKSPVSAALHLVLAFFSASCVWMLLQAEFLAISLVLVYVGAVMVLFLFVVMMLDINIDSIRQGFWKHFPLAGGIGAVIAVEMAFVLTRGFDLPSAKPFPPDVAKVPNAKALGIELFTASSINSMHISSTMRFLRFRKIPMTDMANRMAPSDRKWPSVMVVIMLGLRSEERLRRRVQPGLR